jgi:1,2-diacylglycerol 3-beta-galactosyltransferase
MNRILLLMSDTGGGHRASAEALRAAFLERFGDRYQVDIVDIWTRHTPWPLNQLPKGYRFVINETPWLWKSVWETSQSPMTMQLMMETASRWSKRYILQAINYYNPDLLVAVHALIQDVTLRVLKQTKSNIPLVTVVTDLVSVHPYWFRPGVQRCYVPSEGAYQQALQSGLPPDKLRLYGLPIRPAFAKESRPKEFLRGEFGMAADLPAVLLVGGGEGMGRLDAIATALALRLSASGKAAGQLVIICGRNRELQEQLAARSWPIPVVINGFVSNMSDWMAACDCIITKAGPGTIAEAMTRGLPLVLSSYISGQEEGNVPYVLNNGIGVYLEHPAKIAETIGKWFGAERDKLNEMSERARRLARPQATFQIAEDIAGFLDERSSPRPAPQALAQTPPAPSPDSPIVRQYYDERAVQEWERLGRPFRRLEMLSTLRLWESYFPKSGDICDIGAGPGRYSIELLQRGYRVTLFDLSDKSLALAKHKITELGLRAEAFHVGDARDLSGLADESFDALLLMGPLYHILAAEDRQRVLREARRVLKPGGMALIAYLNTWGVIRAGITEFADSYGDIGYLRSFLQSHAEPGGTPPGKGFTAAYFSTPPEALAEVRAAGLEIVSYAGVEGFAAGLRDAMGALAADKPQVYENIAQIAAESSELAQYRDITEHLHIVAKR